MKTITFFSEKGGMGKTTLSVMFASYLSYAMKEKVYVSDFDFPNFPFYNIRQRELEIFRQSDGVAPRSRNDIFRREVLKNFDEAYQISCWRGKLNPTQQEMARVLEEMKKRKDNLDGYYVLDFPGRFLAGDMAHSFMTAGFVDAVVCLVDSDPQSIQSAMYINGVLRNIRKAGGQRVVVLWNKELAAERRNDKINRELESRTLSEEEIARMKKKDWYGESNRIFAACGIPVIGQRVHEIDVARRDPTPDAPGFIRSTLCWPEQNIRRSCPYMTEIFSEIKTFLDETTDVSDLEFGTEMNNRKI